MAVGIVSNSNGQVLVGQRTIKDAYFEKWEFPGGKLEAGESASQALIRELQEEIGIAVLASEPLMTLEHDYPDRHVRLSIFLVKEYQGDVSSKEGQALQWLAPSELAKLDFLEGNQAIIDKVLATFSF